MRWKMGCVCICVMSLSIFAAYGHAEEATPVANVAARAAWTGPRVDFEKDEHGIVFNRDWWQGGALGVAYYTGPFAQRMPSLIQLGQKMAKKLGRPYTEVHALDLRGYAQDTNGVLVYPDGTARVQLFIMPGGNSTRTMNEIGEIQNIVKEKEKYKALRAAPQSAFNSGMNYIGMCGGFFSAGSGYTINKSINAAWSLWPGRSHAIGPGVSKPLPDVTFAPEHKRHPLLKGVTHGSLKAMFFNGGPESIESDIPDTEYIGRYTGGAMDKIINEWFCIAYRPHDNGQSGRLVITTGHPEAGHLTFLSNMANYAVQHTYTVPRVEIMLDTPTQAVIGDQQMHYYVCTLSDQHVGKKLRVQVTGMTANCDVYVRHDLPPTFKKKDKKSKKKKTKDELAIIKKTKAGDYYIGVFGRHGILNGAEYTLSVSVE